MSVNNKSRWTVTWGVRDESSWNVSCTVNYETIEIWVEVEEAEAAELCPLLIIEVLVEAEALKWFKVSVEVSTIALNILFKVRALQAVDLSVCVF